MKTKILAAALVAPMFAFAPAAAWAHRCPRHHHHHHHHDGKGRIQDQRSRMDQGTSSRDRNDTMGTGQGSTDQSTGDPTTGTGR